MEEMNVRVLVEIVQDRAASDDPLALLETAIAVAGQASGAAEDLIEHYVGAARAANVSWTLIGELLGVSKTESLCLVRTGHPGQWPVAAHHDPQGEKRPPDRRRLHLGLRRPTPLTRSTSPLRPTTCHR
jgi:hypothetical protein